MTDAIDTKATVFLPQTDFPMKAGLAEKEPRIAARWAAEDLYGQLRKAREGRERFILHDGPPYANGDIHMGHAMNKVLKDIIVRSQTLLGKDAPYVPGWDCHGLPIEWKIEEEYRKKKLNKDEVPPAEFRAQCRAYAEKWVAVQRGQFERLGILGDWDNPYLTMKYEAEAAIVAELLKFAESGQLYRGAKPVMWSPVEKTALAEAEVEYEDVTSTQIDVAFEIVEAPNAPELVGAHAVIWTTTPWTIPTNQAIAYGEGITYALVDLRLDAHKRGEFNEDAPLEKFYGKRVLVAEDLLPGFLDRWRKEHEKYADASSDLIYTPAAEWEPIKSSQLAGAIAQHPMHHLGGFFALSRPFLPADHVTTDAGTGLVHMAPDHGEEDFIACKKLGIDPVFAVNDGGFYRDDWAWLGGQGSVINTKFNAPDGPICADLREAGALLSAAPFQHSYPHSWRSKARIIYRCTPQWFIPMDKATGAPDAEVAPAMGLLGGAVALGVTTPQTNAATLRGIALDAIEATRWVPERSRNRIRAMVEGRPDWVISRQRAWGVPIALYVHRQSGQYLNDPAVNARIIAAFTAGGADAWFGADHQALLGADYDLADYEVVNDILDVWFDSGSTHAFVVEARYGPDARADIYVEGSDQHRGWFQSSLLESAGTRGRAPYDAVLTHGFALDGNGRKMSKSLGNVVDPLKIMSESGADILRLWVASTDYFDDVRIGKEVLAGASDAYRKLRNTFRYLLGALEGFREEEKVPVEAMPELERYMLHRLAALDAELRGVVERQAGSESWLEFGRYTRALSDFANNDLSAFFFDIRKDSLYCDVNPASGFQTDKRKAYRTVLDVLFHALVRYAAPIIPFTAEEVWGARYPDGGSVHLLEWPEVPFAGDAAGQDSFSGESRSPGAASDAPETLDPGLRRGTELLEKWNLVRSLRALVNEQIEPLRREKLIGSSLEAEVTVPSEPGNVDFPELFISSTVHKGDWSVAKTTHEKCPRCWRHLPEVSEAQPLCNRCTEVLAS
jgi:isoleucyl-tRNA synthetase